MSKETVGEYLKKERQLRQISIQEVADGTKISISRLRLIEENKFDGLPAEVFVRGFIRNYAEYIGLDPEEAIMRLEEDLKGQAVSGAKQPEMVTATSIDVGNRDAGRFLGIAIGIILLLLVAAGLYYFFFSPKVNTFILSPVPSSNMTVEAPRQVEGSSNDSVTLKKHVSGPKILLEQETNTTAIPDADGKGR